MPFPRGARAVLLQLLLSELQDTPRVRENSTAWGESLDRARVLPTGVVDAELGPRPPTEPLAPRPA